LGLSQLHIVDYVQIDLYPCPRNKEVTDWASQAGKLAWGIAKPYIASHARRSFLGVTAPSPRRLQDIMQLEKLEKLDTSSISSL
jgi:hypothetical protein